MARGSAARRHTQPMFPLSDEEKIRLAMELCELEQNHQNLEHEYNGIQKKFRGKFADLKDRKSKVVKTLLGQDPEDKSDAAEGGGGPQE